MVDQRWAWAPSGIGGLHDVRVWLEWFSAFGDGDSGDAWSSEHGAYGRSDDGEQE
jgi:hypothetical protein